MVQVDEEGIQSGHAASDPESFRPVWMDIGGDGAANHAIGGESSSVPGGANGGSGGVGAGPGAGGGTATAGVGGEGEEGQAGEEIYLARVNWLQDGSLCAQVQNRAQTQLRLLRLDARTGEPTTLVKEKSSIWVNLHHLLRSLPAPALQVNPLQQVCSSFRRVEGGSVVDDGDLRLLRVSVLLSRFDDFSIFAGREQWHCLQD